MEKVDNGCFLQDVEAQLSSVVSDKRGLQLSVERTESELTEQKRLSESLQLVCHFFFIYISC